MINYSPQNQLSLDMFEHPFAGWFRIRQVQPVSNRQILRN